MPCACTRFYGREGNWQETANRVYAEALDVYESPLRGLPSRPTRLPQTRGLVAHTANMRSAAEQQLYVVIRNAVCRKRTLRNCLVEDIRSMAPPHLLPPGYFP